MKNSYDIIVVGGGPAGSTATLHAAKGGASVLLLEKDRDIGLPVRCAEGVDDKGLSDLIDIDPSWISTKITKASMTAPNGKTVKVNIGNSVGTILDRKRFDYDLARYASEAGATVRTRANVTDLIIEDDYVKGVIVKTPFGEEKISCNIVIAADGVESRISRKAGIKTVSKLKDMYSGVQATVSHSNEPDDTIQFFLSENWAPGGYLWIFPKGNGVANIGLGMAGNVSANKKPIEFLNDFIESRYKDASVINWVSGGIPAEPGLKRFTGNGILLVGDAARMVNPLTGGGIVQGMQGAKAAAERALEGLKMNNFSEEFFKKYETNWKKTHGKMHEAHARLRETIYKFTDNDFNYIADKVLAKPDAKPSLLKIFSIAVRRKPALLIDVAKVFAKI